MLLPYIKRNVVSLGPDDLIAALSTPGKPAPLERLSPSGARLVAELKPGPCVLRLADGGGEAEETSGVVVAGHRCEARTCSCIFQATVTLPCSTASL